MKLRQLAVLVLSFTAALSLSSCTDRSRSKHVPSDGIAVEAYRIHTVENSQRLRYSGTVKESATFPCAFSVAGIVEDVLVNEGQSVQTGQLLATLDSQSFRNTLEIAEAGYQRAIDAVGRLRPMNDNGNLPDIKMVEAETSLKQAQAAVEIAQKKLDDCQLHARANGIVGKRSVEVGSGALPGIPAITIVQIDNIKAVMSVHESEINQLSVGASAVVSIPALGDREWVGEISEIGVIADPLSHTYRVKVIVSNEDHQIKPGMICNIVIHKASEENILAIPIEAVMVDEYGKNFVYTLDERNNTVHRTSVNLLSYLRDNLSVVEGLSDGDRVILAGKHKLYDDATVTVLKVTESSK